MWGNRDLRRLPHRLEPRQSTPKDPYENLSEWGFTSPESTLSAVGPNRYQRSSTAISSNLVASDVSTTLNSPILDVTPIGRHRQTSTLSGTSAPKPRGTQNSAPPTNYDNVNVAPRRGRRVVLEPAPVANLCDTFDNNPSYKGTVGQGGIFPRVHSDKNYGRPHCKYSRDRLAIRHEFLGCGGIKDNDNRVTLAPFSKATPSPVRQFREPCHARLWSLPSSPATSSSSSPSSDGRHWF